MRLEEGLGEPLGEGFADEGEEESDADGDRPSDATCVRPAARSSRAVTPEAVMAMVVPTASAPMTATGRSQRRSFTS